MTIIWNIIYCLLFFFKNKVWETEYSSIITCKGKNGPIQLCLSQWLHYGGALGLLRLLTIKLLVSFINYTFLSRNCITICFASCNFIFTLLYVVKIGIYFKAPAGNKAYLVKSVPATSWEVAGSILDEAIGLLNWSNPSSRTMAFGSTQPLTEMSTRNLPGGKGQPEHKADNLTAICEPIV
jgi:hypothetical protein